MSLGSTTSDPKSRVRYIDMDVDNIKQQDVVLALCKLNNFQYNDVWVNMRKTIPSSLETPVAQPFLDGVKKAMAGWQMRGILAIDATVTLKNPTGKEKVVGFVLYQIQRETKNELEVLFLLVSKAYRKKQHASNMMKMLHDRHLYKAIEHGSELVQMMEEVLAVVKQKAGNKQTFDMADKFDTSNLTRGEKMDGYLFSTPGYDLVHIIGVKVERTDAVVAFYHNLGYEDKGKLPGWRDMIGPTETGKHIYLRITGVRTDIEIRKGRCPIV
ncbi:hypothetical protein T484DRAFT_1757414 [Baffinella frigidus]|nr:hypothetical protein T484DRAFT_1757414 [Cryptophyta sp. CCMP2293]